MDTTKNSESWFNRALDFERNGKHREAELCLKKAVEFEQRGE